MECFKSHYTYLKILKKACIHLQRREYSVTHFCKDFEKEISTHTHTQKNLIFQSDSPPFKLVHYVLILKIKDLFQK